MFIDKLSPHQKLVATSDENEAYTTFTGVTRMKQGISPSNTYVDGVAADPALSRAATVAVTSRMFFPRLSLFHCLTTFPGPTVPDEDRAVPLQRAKTTITVSSDARERIRGLTSPTSAGGSLPQQGMGLSRNPSSATSTSRATPSRGLSVRRPGMAAPTLNVPGIGSPNRPSPTDRARTPGESRPAESFYDNYMDAYADNAQVQSAPPLSRSQSSRIGNWARNNATPLPPLPSNAPQRTRSVAPSSYAPSSAGGTMRRKTTRRIPRSKSMYEEEEEGYGSGGDYEETVYEMSKIRIKVIYHRLHSFKALSDTDCYISSTIRMIFVGWRLRLRCPSRISLIASPPSSGGHSKA